MSLKITDKEKKELKGQAILAQKQEGYFAVRILSRVGNFTSKELVSIANIAESYGKGYVSVTNRLTAEIPYIKYEDIEKVKEEIKKNNLVNGGTGKKIRPIMACKGTVCVHGLIDTQKLGGEIQDKFFAKELAAKCKIGVVGCPNNCGKAQLNDIGIMPQVKTKINHEKCVACGKCTTVCKEKALIKEGKEIIYDKDKCVNCGKCADVCPFKAIDKIEEGIAIYLGGRFGRKAMLGKPLNRLFKEDEVIDTIEKILNYYKENANSLERIGKMIERIGFEEVEKNILK